MLVIGGGAAGLMAALKAAQAGAKVTLLEKNEKLGKKLYITGKGRCNVTNVCDTEEFLRNVPRNPRFLYAALNAFGPGDMLSLLREWGCDTKVERGRRAFPVSDKASDVTKALEKGLRALDVRVLLGTPVNALAVSGGQITGAVTEQGRLFPAKCVVLCTGGLSYPSTGSTGDGHRMARELGHSVTSCVPSLTGLNTKETWPSELQGLSLKNVTLTARNGKKTVYSELGELLFTHFGISGPLALECSAHLPESGQGTAEIDLKPGLTVEQTEARLAREIAAAGKKRLRSMLETLLPARMAGLFPGIVGLDGQKVCCQLSAAERRLLAEGLKALPLTLTGLRPFTEAVVTRGGVTVKEINPSTMESRRVRGLYLAGELMDVDAHTGGYNLQIAFSTGALAGESAAKQAQDL